MPMEGLGWTFDTVAEDYDRFRPTYPQELFDGILAYQPVTTGSRVLEIGAGTGQATLPFFAAGCVVTAVEPGTKLAAVLTRKFAGQPLTVVNSAFEAWEGPAETFDLAYSASAFHWIPEDTGYRKVYRGLKPGGVFARFASHPYYYLPGQEALWEEIQQCYRLNMPPRANPPDPARRYDEEDAARRSAIAAQYGFTDIATRVYYRDLQYSGEEYARRLSIESDKIAMEPQKRVRLLADIASAIERHGGRIVVRDMIDLNLARKPE